MKGKRRTKERRKGKPYREKDTEVVFKKKEKKKK